MTRIAINNVRGHWLRYLLSFVSVILGIAFVAGTFVLSDSIRGTINSLIDQTTIGTDVQVRGVPVAANGVGSGSANDNGRAFLPISLRTTLAAVPGVQLVTPDLSGTGLLVGSDGTVVRHGGAPTLAVAFNTNSEVVRLVQGRAPVGPNEVVVESATLKLSKLAVGDRTQAVIGGEPRPVTVVGEADFPSSLAGATLILLDPEVAQALFAPDGKVPTFSLRADPGVSQNELRDRVAAVLPADAQAITRDQDRAETRKTIDQGLGFVTIFFEVFAAISLVVGAFVIANTFSIVIAQRTRELGLLRALGASRGQVWWTVLGEAAIIGLIGSVLGLGAGILLAAGLKTLIKAGPGVELSGGLPVAVRTVVVSIIVGLLVTVLSAAWPARRAARVTPLEAMRVDPEIRQRGLRLRGVIAVVLLVPGIAAVATGVTRTSVAWLLVALGAILILVGALVLAPVAARPVVRLVSLPFTALSRVVGRLARDNALRNPRRTAATASALMIGLALIGTLAVIASSTTASVSGIIKQQLKADYVLSSGGTGPMAPQVGQRAAALPGVSSVVTISPVNLQIDATGGPAAGGRGRRGRGQLRAGAFAMDAKGLSENVDISMVSGSVTTLDRGQLLVDKTTAQAHHWTTGSVVSTTVGTLPAQMLTIGGVYDDNPLIGSSFLVGRALYAQAVPAALQVDFGVLVKAEPGADLTQLHSQLVALVKPYLIVSVQSGDEFTSSQVDSIRMVLVILYVLLALSVVIAVLGIINTLALSVFERTREIGLLRAIGLGRGQLTRMITIESVATALFGAIMGLILGIGFGIALQHALAGQGLHELAIPWSTIIVVLIFSGVAGVVAAVLPAIRAAYLNVLRAIATE